MWKIREVLRELVVGNVAAAFTRYFVRVEIQKDNHVENSRDRLHRRDRFLRATWHDATRSFHDFALTLMYCALQSSRECYLN